MTDADFPDPILTERRIVFDYGYWMNCDCGYRSYLSPVDYMTGANGSHMACQHCTAVIHFGPAVAAIRDRDDPALVDEVVSTLAWYHTSTSADWPSPEFVARFEEELSWIERDFGPNREQFVADHTAKALHVGTYETAVENMLRRMTYQGDGGSDFYLYRVALRLDPRRINPGYRDENYEIAADISVGELDSDDLDAVRYLNVHEALGALSLAVRPSAIAAVQCIRIPIEGHAVAMDPSALSPQTDALRSATNTLIKAETAASTLDRRDLRMMQLGGRPDPTGLARSLGKSQNRLYESWHELEQRLEELCLPNVSVVVRHDFSDAMAHWRAEHPQQSVPDFISRYRSVAALLEHSAEATQAIISQPWRPVGAA